MFKIPKDKMSPLERMEAFSKGKDIDRIPCCPFLGESCAPLFGHTIKEHNFKKDVIVDTAISSFDLLESDSISTGPGLQGVPEAMGTIIEFHENSTPSFKKEAISSLDEIYKLNPIRPYKDGKIYLFLEALKEIKDRLDKKVIVGTTVGGPFTTASFLRGTEIFLKDTLISPEEKVYRLLEISTQSVINYIDAACDIGLVPGLADPMAS